MERITLQLRPWEPPAVKAKGPHWKGYCASAAPHLNLACTVIMVLVKAMHSPCTANLHALYAALTLTGCSGFENNRGERSTPEQRDAWGGSVPHQS